MPAGHGERVPGIRLPQVGRQLHALRMHGIARTTDLFGDGLDALAEQLLSAAGDVLHHPRGAIAVPELESSGHRVSPSRVVVHQVGQDYVHGDG
ncbi:MAG: hypothetical protein QF879_22540, partial [Candidatus Latescibacteria bacterium]|nr:hypothetical protein [Candidatus Latescibacterota bacterium]